MNVKLLVVDGLNVVVEGMTEDMIKPGQEWYDANEGEVLFVTEVNVHGENLTMVTFYEADSCVVERIDATSFLEFAYLIVAEDATPEDFKN